VGKNGGKRFAGVDLIGQHIFKKKVKVVELTLEDGSKMLCRGGEEAVYRAWGTYPVVSARWTGEEETMQWIEEEQDTEGVMGWEPE